MQKQSPNWEDVYFRDDQSQSRNSSHRGRTPIKARHLNVTDHSYHSVIQDHQELGKANFAFEKNHPFRFPIELPGKFNYQNFQGPHQKENIKLPKIKNNRSISEHAQSLEASFESNQSFHQNPYKKGNMNDRSFDSNSRSSAYYNGKQQKRPGADDSYSAASELDTLKSQNRNGRQDPNSKKGNYERPVSGSQQSRFSEEEGDWGSLISGQGGGRYHPATKGTGHKGSEGKDAKNSGQKPPKKYNDLYNTEEDEDNNSEYPPSNDGSQHKMKSPNQLNPHRKMNSIGSLNESYQNSNYSGQEAFSSSQIRNHDQYKQANYHSGKVVDPQHSHQRHPKLSNDHNSGRTPVNKEEYYSQVSADYSSNKMNSYSEYGSQNSKPSAPNKFAPQTNGTGGSQMNSEYYSSENRDNLKPRKGHDQKNFRESESYTDYMDDFGDDDSQQHNSRKKNGHSKNRSGKQQSAHSDDSDRYEEYEDYQSQDGPPTRQKARKSYQEEYQFDDDYSEDNYTEEAHNHNQQKGRRPHRQHREYDSQQDRGSQMESVSQSDNRSRMTGSYIHGSRGNGSRGDYDSQDYDSQAQDDYGSQEQTGTYTGTGSQGTKIQQAETQQNTTLTQQPETKKPESKPVRNKKHSSKKKQVLNSLEEGIDLMAVFHEKVPMSKEEGEQRLKEIRDDQITTFAPALDFARAKNQKMLEKPSQELTPIKATEKLPLSSVQIFPHAVLNHEQLAQKIAADALKRHKALMQQGLILYQEGQKKASNEKALFEAQMKHQYYKFST